MRGRLLQPLSRIRSPQGHFVLDMVRAIVRLVGYCHSAPMEYRVRTQPVEWACTKFCRIALDDDSVEHFFLWLCDHTPEQIEEHFVAHRDGKPVWYDPVESIWGWDAPRQRMAKRLWQLFHNDASDEEFRKQFTFAIGPGCFNSASLLAPIQRKLQWVMDGLVSRQQQDRRVGQTDWGERWWLPPEQSEFLRQQLKNTHAELIERSSDYEDATRWGLSHYVTRIVQGIELPSGDPERVYVGTRLPPHGIAFVCVEDRKGNEYPLKHGDRPYLDSDGVAYEWGYGGGGPTALSRSLLTDVLDGDVVLAEELDRMEDGFFEKFILRHPREKNLRISRAAVLRWLKSIKKLAAYEERRVAVAQRIAAHAKTVAEHEERLRAITEAGELRSQRFDTVPDSFEAALYLDLMHMLEHGGAALRCARCGLPIPYDQSGRANKQRARSRKGQPIYHPDCFAEVGRLRKKAYWQERSKSQQFREKERARAREYRRLP